MEVDARAVMGYFLVAVFFCSIGFAFWKISELMHREDVCVLQAGFTCVEKRLFASGGEPQLQLTAKNNLGRWIRITGFMCSSEVPDPSLGRPRSELVPVSLEVLPDSEFEVSGKCTASEQEIREGKFRGLVYIYFDYRDEPFTPGQHAVVGNIRGEISP